jgi:hypothetical protein
LLKNQPVGFPDVALHVPVSASLLEMQAVDVGLSASLLNFQALVDRPSASLLAMPAVAIRFSASSLNFQAPVLPIQGPARQARIESATQSCEASSAVL